MVDTGTLRGEGLGTSLQEAEWMVASSHPGPSSAPNVKLGMVFIAWPSGHAWVSCVVLVQKLYSQASTWGESELYIRVPPGTGEPVIQLPWALLSFTPNSLYLQFQGTLPSLIQRDKHHKSLIPKLIL